jgi:hypothetical protein
VKLKLHVDAGEAELRAGGASVRKTNAEGRLAGNLALVAGASRPLSARQIWRFNQWAAAGTLLTHNPEQTFGPVLWTQYTVSRGILKLTALFPLLRAEDRKTAQLEMWVSSSSGYMSIADLIRRLKRIMILERVCSVWSPSLPLHKGSRVALGGRNVGTTSFFNVSYASPDGALLVRVRSTGTVFPGLFTLPAL